MPAFWNGKFIHMNQNGDLLVIDPETGRTESSVETEAIQPVSLAPTLWKNARAFAGRKGTVVAVDLQRNKVMWDRKIDSGVFQDITIGSIGLYPFTGNVYHVGRFSSVTGSTGGLPRCLQIFLIPHTFLYKGAAS